MNKELDNYKQRVYDTIERLENYPTCMSCYLTVEEATVATYLKDKFIEILKEELLNEN